MPIDLQDRCPICHRGCSLAEPRCHRGRQLAETLAAPQCPGCHIGCSLADPQCGRGLRFRDAWQAGEEIPERRRPGGPGPQGAPGPNDGKSAEPKAGRPGPGGPGGRQMDSNKKLMFLLTGIVPRALGELNGTDQDQILSWLTRQEGVMTYSVMPERARVDAAALYGNLEELLAVGYIRDEYSDWGTQYYWITDAGRAAAKRAEEERETAIKERFSALTDAEKQQLEELVGKLLPGR